MKRRKPGKRHTLLIYRRAMDRLWMASLVLGILLAIIYLWMWYGDTPLLQTDKDLWLLAGAVFCIAFAVFSFLGRYVAYVQPRRDHLRIVTPFLRMNVSYRRILGVHPANFSQLFPPSQASWAQHSFLEPFYGSTAVVVDLTAYPMSPILLRLFLAPQMFSPQSNGLVLLVPDWMDFSTELDTFRASPGPTRSARRSVLRGGR